MQQPNSAANCAKQMMSDLFQILKLALTTKFGLVITLLCATIYFFTLWMTTTTKSWTLYVWIITLIGIFLMTWLTWFKNGCIQPEQPTTVETN